MIIRPDLLVRARYSRNDYLTNLIQLLPRGPGWRIPFPNEQDVAPDAITSVEAWGSVTVIG